GQCLTRNVYRSSLERNQFQRTAASGAAQQLSKPCPHLFSGCLYTRYFSLLVFGVGPTINSLVLSRGPPYPMWRHDRTIAERGQLIACSAKVNTTGPQDAGKFAHTPLTLGDVFK